jgi:hypothetical protein
MENNLFELTLEKQFQIHSLNQLIDECNDINELKDLFKEFLKTSIIKEQVFSNILRQDPSSMVSNFDDPLI